MKEALYSSYGAILSFSKWQNMFFQNESPHITTISIHTLMLWSPVSIFDIMWALLPTQWAQRLMEIQTHSQYDIMWLNDLSPLLTLCRHAASPSYCPVFISSAFPDLAYDRYCLLWGVCHSRSWRDPSDICQDSGDTLKKPLHHFVNLPLPSLSTNTQSKRQSI